MNSIQNSSVIKIGLVGLGSMGSNHLRILNMIKGVEISFISDSNEKKLLEVSKKYDLKYVTDPVSEIEKVDGVIIATPTSTHFDLIKRFEGKVNNIFVEKPLASDIRESKEIVDLADKEDIKIQVGFIERFNPSLIGLHSILGESEGVISIDFQRTNKLDRILDTDVVYDLMIHDIDLSLYLNGPAKKIDSQGIVRNNCIEFASAMIVHQNNKLSRIQASRITDKKIRKIQATCFDRYIDCDLFRRELISSRQSTIKAEEGKPYVISTTEEIIEVSQQEALLSELLTFIALCRDEKDTTYPDANSALAAAEVCEEIRRGILNASL